MNIQLNYLYRDGANYKQHSYEVFTNNNSLNLKEVQKRLVQQLIDGEYFYSHKWGLPDLHVSAWDNDIDHTWHEYDGIEETTDQPTKGDIIELLKLIESLDKHTV